MEKNDYFKNKTILATTYIVLVAGPSFFWFIYRLIFFSFRVFDLKSYDWWLLFGGIISSYTGIMLLFIHQYSKKKSEKIVIPLYFNILIGIIVMVESFFEAFPLTIPILICHYSLLRSTRKVIGDSKAGLSQRR